MNKVCLKRPVSQCSGVHFIFCKVFVETFFVPRSCLPIQMLVKQLPKLVCQRFPFHVAERGYTAGNFSGVLFPGAWDPCLSHEENVLDLHVHIHYLIFVSKTKSFHLERLTHTHTNTILIHDERKYPWQCPWCCGLSSNSTWNKFRW